MTPDGITFIYGTLAGAGITLAAQRLWRWLIDHWQLGEPTWAEACEVYERRRQVPAVVVRRDHEGEGV